MISAHHMQEIYIDNQRNLEAASENKRFQREIDHARHRPGILSRLYIWTRSLIENIGCHLLGFPPHWRFEI